jgi:hypothetical protein
MLTDDDLTNELGAAFRDSAGEMRYHGRRRPRRTAVVAVPAVAVGASLAAVAIAATVNAGDDPSPRPIASAPTTSTVPTPAPLGTEKVRVAGYTFTYQRAETEKTAPLIATMATELPDGLTPVSATNGAKAWVGKDPKGDNAIYVRAPTRNGGNLFELHSSIWTQDQLVDLFHKGTPKTVPLVKE